MSEVTEELVLCQCNDPEHQIIFSSWEDDDEVYMTVHLAPLPLFQRIAHAVKYIFGYRCKYGDFDEVFLKPSDYSKFMKVTEKLFNAYRKEHETDN